MNRVVREFGSGLIQADKVSESINISDRYAQKPHPCGLVEIPLKLLGHNFTLKPCGRT